VDITVFGLGYVGTVTAACLARAGHTVYGVDPDAGKVALLERGVSPVIEPQLDDLVRETRAAGSFVVGIDGDEAVARSDVSLVCVGSPSNRSGGVDLQFLEQVSAEIGAALAGRRRFHGVMYRSTMPPGSVENELLHILADKSGRTPDTDFGVAMCPEFLREGSGVGDFFEPPFTVIGTRDERMARLAHDVFDFLSAPVFDVPLATAEALKYACNSFHALKVAFTNEVARLFASAGVDGREMMQIFIRDERLNASAAYLRPGFAFGGPCLPKDLRALLDFARMQNVDTPLLHSVLPSNDEHLRSVLDRVLARRPQRVALLGLSFKQETDDLRESPFVELAERLTGKGVDVRIFDPIVNPGRLRGANLRYVTERLQHLQRMLHETPQAALEGADVAVVGAPDGNAIEALIANAPRHVIDVSGRLPRDVEKLAGYEGAAW
jgi:GDP-mannose 6-dehydrogenase